MPQPEKAKAIASEPYDVINSTEARLAAEGNPISFLHVVRPEIDFPEGQDLYHTDVYRKANDNLVALIENEHLVEQDTDSIFIYRQVFQGREQYGVVCCYDVEQYRDETIKKHEKTRPDKEDDRTRHITTCSAHAEPVFLSFKDDPVINRLIQADSQSSPMVDFVADDDVQHTVWKVPDPNLYVAAFKNLDCVYIADGHHRTAAGERAASQRQKENPVHTGQEEYNRVLSVMFPDSQLEILAYNRVLSELGEQTVDNVVDAIRKLGVVEKTEDSVPQQATHICFYLDGQWYRLEFDQSQIEFSDPIESLDVALLQSKVLTPIFGVGDPIGFQNRICRRYSGNRRA